MLMFEINKNLVCKPHILVSSPIFTEFSIDYHPNYPKLFAIHKTFSSNFIYSFLEVVDN